LPVTKARIAVSCFSQSPRRPGGGRIIYVGYEISQNDILGNNEAKYAQKQNAP
jgi:hypothetical protein